VTARRALRRALVLQAASVCLRHPDAEFHAVLPAVRDALARTGRRERRAAALLDGFLEWARAAGEEAAGHYAEVFDFRNRRSLHMSWWTDGDTRRRGETLVGFLRAYRRAGWEFTADELPDFLPALLEFGARLAAEGRAREADALLAAQRPAVLRLREQLHACGTPYAAVLDAVGLVLPGRAGRPVPAGAEQGPPPVETVGIGGAGFGPYGTGAAAAAPAGTGTVAGREGGWPG
jgi:nitrate reductase delta subunit